MYHLAKKSMLSRSWNPPEIEEQKSTAKLIVGLFAECRDSTTQLYVWKRFQKNSLKWWIVGGLAW